MLLKVQAGLSLAEIYLILAIGRLLDELDPGTRRLVEAVTQIDVEYRWRDIKLFLNSVPTFKQYETLYNAVSKLMETVRDYDGDWQAIYELRDAMNALATEEWEEAHAL